MPTQTEPTRRKVTSTVVTETVPAGQGAQVSDFYNRPFWEVIHSFTPEEWRSHLVRVYRSDERWEHTVSLQENKFTEDFSEDTIFAKWGGGRFLLWLYGPPEGRKLVMPPFRMEIEGQPRMFSGAAPAQPVADVRAGGDPLMQMLIEEVRELRRSGGAAMLQETLKQSMDILATTYKSAASVVRETQTPAGGEVDEFEREFRRALLQKMLTPPDPMEGIKGMVAMGTAIVAAVKDLSGSLSLGGKQDSWGTLLQALPSMADKAVSGLHEYRLAAEAQARTIDVRGARVIDASPAPNDPAPPATGPTVVAPTQSATEGKELQGPSIEWVLQRVVKTIKDSDQTLATGEDLYDFLIVLAPELVDQLKPLDKDKVLALFHEQPMLAKVADHPRLPKMIEEFLAAANA